ncbi:hypothetical protein JCM8547_003047 [Rhodosporidiobolus lusitaniae]
MSREEVAHWNTLTGNDLASQSYSWWIIGPGLVGWTGNLLLWGMVAGWTGVFLRSEAFKREPFRRKLLLFWVVFSCTLSAGSDYYLIFRWGTTQARDAFSMIAPSPVNALQPTACAMTGVPTQTFLAMRAIKLLRARWAKIACSVFFGLLISVQTAFMIFNTALNYEFGHDRLSGRLLNMVVDGIASGVWLWASAAIDVGITTILVVVLRKRIAGVFEDTDSKLRRLSWLAVQSASYTAVLATVGATTAYAARGILYSSLAFTFWYPLPSCYGLALLTSLSSRAIFQNSPSRGGDNLPLDPPAILIGNTSYGLGGKGCSCRCMCGTSALPRRMQLEMGEKSGGGSGRVRSEFGTGSGVMVAEEVSIVVETTDDDEQAYGTMKSRSRLPVPSLTRRENWEDEAEKGMKADGASEGGSEQERVLP